MCVCAYAHLYESVDISVDIILSCCPSSIVIHMAELVLVEETDKFPQPRANARRYNIHIYIHIYVYMNEYIYVCMYVYISPSSVVIGVAELVFIEQPDQLP